MKLKLTLALIVVAALSIPAYSVPPVSNSFLIGTWVNTDQLTGGIIAFVIAEDQLGDLYIFAFGQCFPTPCQWGWTPCVPYAELGGRVATGFMALYEFDFKETWLVASQVPHPNYSVLRVTDFNFYLDPDTRMDFWSEGYFVKID